MATVTQTVTAEQSAKARWTDHSKGTWIAAGGRLQVAVPDCAGGEFLCVEFELAQGRSCDFDVMLEAADESVGAIRLYGPTRRARSLRTVVPVTQAGMAFVTFDNIASWMLQKELAYTICVSETEPPDSLSYSTLAFGRNIMRQLPSSSAAPSGEAVAASPPKEVSVAAGAAEIVSLDVLEGQSLELNFEVVRGGDVDFLMVLLPLGANGEPDEDGTPTRLYGPTRRSSSLHTKMLMPHAGAVQLQFDATSSWFTSKLVRYSLDCRADEAC